MTNETPSFAPANTSLAPFSSRVLAQLIDLALSGLVALVPFIGWAIGLGYFLVRDSLPFLKGQSIGKKAMKIKVTDADGADLVGNYVPSLIRNLTLMIPLMPIVELYILYKNPANMARIGDQWALTRVINA